MRVALLVCVAALMLSLLAGCGDSSQDSSAAGSATDDTTSPAPAESPEQAATGGWSQLKRLAGAQAVRLIVPRGPSPDRVVIRDLKRGTGAPIQPGDVFYSRYISFDYENEKAVEPYWGDSAGSLIWGTGERVPGWEPGLRGMRAGGVRELIVPSRLAYDTGARVYLVELTRIEKQ